MEPPQTPVQATKTSSEILRIYQYKPLTESDSIRLIALQPSADLNSQVQCTVLQTTFSDCEDLLEEYAALSYVWGDANNTTTIQVDGCDFDVTVNLDSALRHLRDKEDIKKMWVDAICINQADDVEKSVQVSQMWRVYNTAKRTMIYLGDATEASKRCFGMLREWMEYKSSVLSQTLASRDDATVSSRLTRSHYISRISVDDYVDVAERQWFPRVWILQEFLFSRHPWVCCGQLRLPWDNFCAATIELNYDQESLDERPVLVGMHIQRMFGPFNRTTYVRYRSEIQDGKSQLDEAFRVELKSLLQARRGLGVKDARDMIFAHTSIARRRAIGNTIAPGVQALRADYTKTKKEIYESYASGTLTKSTDYTLLFHAERGSEFDHDQDGIASWAPDWMERYSIRPDEDYRWESGPEDDFPRTKATVGLGTCSILGCVGSGSGMLKAVSSILSLHVQEIVVQGVQGEVEKLRWWRDVTKYLFLTDFKPDDVSNMHSSVIKGSRGIRNYLREHLYPFQVPEPEFHNAEILVHKERAQSIIEIMFWNELSLWLDRGYLQDGLTTLDLVDRKFALLQDDTLVLVPPTSQVGDIACFLHGTDTPFIVRPIEIHETTAEARNDELKKAFAKDFPAKGYENLDITHCRFVGKCFVEGLMYGEFAKQLHLGEEKWQKKIFAIH